MTKKEWVEIQKETWKELANTGAKERMGLDHDDFIFKIHIHCFLQGFLKIKHDKFECENCPLEWGKHYQCFHKNSIVRVWLGADAIPDRMNLAAVIRDIPLKEN